MSAGQGRGFWASLFGTPQPERFSPAELEHLHHVLARNQVINDSNRHTVVEALRRISELVIWGDQHDPTMVEYFLTNGLLGHFTRILKQRSNRRGHVAQQVLQTLSILLQNVRSQQTVYYLFSNNHINEIVTMQFDWEDDEVLGYFINLLKAVSLRLDEDTVQFFFFAASNGQPATFPLYSEAVKFVNHRDSMVRAAVKTLTLNVYAVRSPQVCAFVASYPPAAYFADLATYVCEQCLGLDRLLGSWDEAAGPSASAVGAVETCLAEIEDTFSYFSDVLDVGQPMLQDLLLDHLWRRVLGPVLFWPLIREDVGLASLAPSSAPQRVRPGLVGPLCSLYVLERVFFAVVDPSFLGTLVAALLGEDERKGVAGGGPGGVEGGKDASTEVTSCPRAPLPPSDPSGPTPSSRSPRVPASRLEALQYRPVAFRRAFLGMLRGSDAQLGVAAVRVVAALLRSKALEEDLLDAVGLLPRHRRTQRELLEALVREEGSLRLEERGGGEEEVGVSGLQAQDWALPSLSLPLATPDPPYSTSGFSPSTSGLPSSASGLHSATSGLHSSASGLHPSTSGLSSRPHNRAPPSERRFLELGGALAAALRAPLPPPALAALGWTLHALLGRGKGLPAAGWAEACDGGGAGGGGTAELSPHSPHPPHPGPSNLRPALAAAAARTELAWREILRGPWADALLPLASEHWRAARGALLRSGAGPLHAAVETWAQAAEEGCWGASATGEGVGEAAAAEEDPSSVRRASSDSHAGPRHVPAAPAGQGLAAGALAARRAAHAAATLAGLRALLAAGDVPEACPAAAPEESAMRAAERPDASGALEEAEAAARSRTQSSASPLPNPSDAPSLNPPSAAASEDGSLFPPPSSLAPSSPPPPVLSPGRPCTVSFARGTERAVLLCVAGAPSAEALRELLGRGAPSPAQARALVAAHVSPLAALVAWEVSAERPQLVASAPLLGAAPAVDARHARWLHVEVRPGLRGALRALKGAAHKPGKALERRLAQGHWVLAFPDAQAAAAAAADLAEAAQRTRELYAALCAPLFGA